MKKWIALLSCVLLCMAMGLVFVGCAEKTPNITLVDFNATVTDEVGWGDEYALRRIVEDTDGKSYSLDVSVKTKAGADVTVVSNKFQAIDLGGYVITYTAKITDKDARTSVVTLTVVPDEVVTIVLPEVTTAYKAGDEITIPEAKVNNVYEGEIGKATVKSLSYTETADNNVIALDAAAATYTPACAGKLTVVYSYADAEDKTLVIEVGVNRGENNAIASGKDSVLDFSLMKVEAKLEWNDEGNYIVYAPKTAGAEVRNCNMDFNSDARPHINEIKGKYDYLHIKVNPRREEGKGNPNNRVRFTLFNDGALSDMLSGKGGADPKGLPFNEWSDVYIPVASVNTEKGMVITAQFNYAHNFYDQMSEMWLDGFDFVSDAQLKVAFNQSDAVNEQADVTLTMGTDREDGKIATCDVTVRNSEGEVVDGAIENGVWSKKLAVGTYSYRIELADTKYVLMDGIYGVDYIEGTFDVQNVVVIEVPEITETYKALDTIAIPNAKVVHYIEGDKGNATVKEIKYTEADGAVIALETNIANYISKNSGKLSITYSFTGAVDTTLEIDVKINRHNRVIATGKDGVSDIKAPDTKTQVTWNEDDGYYVFAPKVAGQHSDWSNLEFAAQVEEHVKSMKDRGVAGEFDFLHLRVNIRQGTPQAGCENYRCRLILFTGQTSQGVTEDLCGKGKEDPNSLAYNTWYDLYIPADKIVADKYFRILNGRFDKKGNNDYESVEAIWLGGFEFVKNAELKATFEQDAAVEDKAEVRLTIGTNREDGRLAGFNVIVKNSAGVVVDGAIEAGVWSKKLAVGTYSYRIELDDVSYIVKNTPLGAKYTEGEKSIIEGTFTVQNAVEIELPEITATYKAGGTVTIPNAKAIHYQEGDKGNATIKEIKYTELDGTLIPLDATITSYKAENAGTLTITYSFEGAVDKTLEIAVNPNRDGRLLATGKDALNDVTYANGFANLTYDKEKGYYVFKPNADKTGTFWEDIKVTADVKNHVNAIKNDYDYLHLRVYCKQDNNMNHPEWLARVRLFQGKCNTYLYGDKDTWENVARYSFNEWCDIYLPVNLVDFAASADQLLSGQFLRENSGADYCNMSEMWLDGFEFVKAADISDADLIATPATTEKATTLTVTTGRTDSVIAGYTLRVYKGKVEVEGGTLEGNVWSKKLEAGTYTYKIKTTGSKDVFIQDGKVTEFITGTFTVE